MRRRRSTPATFFPARYDCTAFTTSEASVSTHRAVLVNQPFASNCLTGYLFRFAERHLRAGCMGLFFFFFLIIHALIYDYRLLSFAAQAWFSSLACARVAFAKVTAAASVPACPSREGRRDVAMGGASSTMLLVQKKSSLAGRQNIKKRNRVCDADVCFEWYTDVAWVEQRVKRAPLLFLLIPSCQRFYRIYVEAQREFSHR